MSPRAMTRYVFEEIKYLAAKTVECYACGKKVRRSKTFWMTLNPWNKNAAGEPASRSEIIEKLRAEASQWMVEGERCTPCLREAVR